VKRTLVSSLLVAAVAGAAGCISTPDELVEEKQFPLVKGRPEGVRISPRVSAKLTDGKPVKVRLHIAEEEFSTAEVTGGEISCGTIEDGKLVDGILNGKAATSDDFASASEAFKVPLAEAEARQSRVRAEKWKKVAASLGLSRDAKARLSDGPSSIEVTLSPQEIGYLAKGDIADVVSIESTEGEPGVVPIGTAFAAIDISSVAHPGGWDGTGIGIFYSDPGPVETDRDCINSSGSRLFRYGVTTPPYPVPDHATQMVCVVQATAPGARVFYSPSPDYGNGMPASISVASPPVYVSGLSFAWDDVGEYIGADRDYDNRILSNRIAHFSGAGNDRENNEGAKVRTPAVAYNVITIGASNASDSPSSVAWYSNGGDPETGADKPELVAPGHSIRVSPELWTSGTSASTAMATGFAADLMEQFSFLRGRPALLRAYLFGASRRITADSNLVGPLDGYGEIDYRNSTYGRWWWWDTVNSGTFVSDTDGDGRKEVVVSYSLTPGTYHAVVSWLVSGTYVFSNLKPNMDIDLWVRAPGGGVFAGLTTDQNHEHAKFTVSTTGTYKFVLERYWNSGSGDVVMGLVVRKR